MEDQEEAADTRMITLSDDKASLVLNDLLSVVQDSSAVATLSNIDISFTCKVCKTEKGSLRELVAHLSDPTCTPPRKRGRPLKIKSEIPDEEYRPVVEHTMENVSDTGRNTRLRSGAMKRKSVLDFFNEKDHVVTVEEIEEAPRVKRGRGRPRKVVPEVMEVVDLEDVEGLEECLVKEEGVVMAEEGEVLPKDRTMVVNILKKEGEEDAAMAEVDSMATEQLTTESVEAGEMIEENYEFMEENDEPLFDDEAENDNQKVVVLMRTKNKAKPFGIPKYYRKRHSNVHKCHLCHHRGFPTKEEVEVHEQCHFKEDPTSSDYYKCIECPFTHKVWARMLMHLITHEKYKSIFKQSDTLANIIGDFTCPMCKKKFDRKANMLQHLEFVHNKKERVCEICSKTLPGMDEKSFQRHLDKCRNIEFRCDSCEYSTVVRENLRMHQKLHDGQGLQCEVCHAIFPTRQRYKTHCLTHTEDRPRFVCDTCGGDFVSMDAVKKHIARFHSGITQREWSCDLCSYKGLLEYDLKKHKQQVHNKKFKCSECAFSTNVEIAFKNHHEYHAPDRLFRCPYSHCFVSFCSSAEIATHISSVHNLQYKNQCPMCFRHFKKKTTLLRHLITHTDAKPYFCAECGLKFYSHTTYYRHRHKTGHDAKREGVASVPQNITIQYLDESERQLPSVSTSTDIDGVLRQATEEAQLAKEVQSGGLVRVTADPIPMVAQEEETPVALATLLSQDVDFNAKVIEVPIVDSTGTQCHVNVVTDGMTLEEEVVIQENDTPMEQVNFVVQIQNEDGGEMREVIMTEEEMMEHLAGNQVVFQEMQQQPPSEGEEYAVLMLPPGGEGGEGGEPEVALSMLQLSTGPNLQ